MALITPLSAADAERVARAWSLGSVTRVEPLAAGSVNSNFILTTGRGGYFLRIYEEQGADGVAFEWRLLDHLTDAKVPCPKRIKGPLPGEVSVASKPVGVFELMGGFERCRRQVAELHMAAVGDALARVHLASEGFELTGNDRFDAASLKKRLDTVDVIAHPELADDVAKLRATLDAIPAYELPKGIVHGDLFRDNVRWEGDTLVALLDWESASRGVLVFDVAVVLLAWCWSDRFEWSLARAFMGAYHRARPLSPEERRCFGYVATAACARFATTRITDFYLRGGPGSPGYRDYNRFLARLDAVRAMAEGELAARLTD